MLTVYLKVLILEINGVLNALLFWKSEINLTAVLAGLSVLLNHYLTDTASRLVKISDYHLKTCSLVALLVVMVAMVVTPILLWTTTLKLVWLLVIFMETTNGVKLTLSPPVLIMSKPTSIPLALVNYPLLFVRKLVMVIPPTVLLIPRISTRVLRLTELLKTKNPSRLKSTTMVPLKFLSLSMKIS